MIGQLTSRAIWARAGLAAIALTLAACSETLGGFNTHVAEVDAEPGAQASNAGNIASLSDVIQRHPTDAAAYNTRGVVYAKLGKYSNAIEDFSHTIELDPHFSGAYTNRALAYRQTKKDDLAMQDFNQAITVNPNDAAAYLGRGNLERAHGDYASAMNDLNQAIRLNPEGAQAYHARGLIYQRQGDNVQAITDFNNAIDRDPFAGEPYQARGQSLMATGKYEAAIEDFNAALNVNADNSEAWAGLGFCYEKLNNHAEGGRILPARRVRQSQQQPGARGPAALELSGGLSPEGSSSSGWRLQQTAPLPNGILPARPNGIRSLGPRLVPPSG